MSNCQNGTEARLEDGKRHRGRHFRDLFKHQHRIEVAHAASSEIF